MAWWRLQRSALLILVVGLTLPLVARSETRELRACSYIDEPNARLRCYDQVMKQGRAGKAPAPDTKDQAEAQLQEEIEEVAERLSPVQRNWLSLNDEDAAVFAITRYKPNYFLLYTHSFSVNKRPYQDTSQEDEIDDTETKFQLSFKSRLARGLFGTDASLWFGYTQTAFFQAYNTDYSSPFRETNYEPEVILAKPLKFDAPFGLTGRLATLSVNHQSNGRGEPLSRSWNRVTAGLLFDRDDFVVGLKTWVRIPEDDDDDDNPNIEDYVGRAELTTAYTWDDKTLAAVLRNNLSDDDNRGSVQLDFSFPLFKSIKGYLQLYSGYGESLIDYDHYNNRIGAGLMLTDWM